MKRKLQVFISSTYTDLVEERQAAVAAVLKAGHIPAGMELFTAGDKSQMVTIERWIDDSDVYMLVLGGRYGSVEPITNLSYTELEYDYAVQQGKPLFAVVINDQHQEFKVRTYGTDFMEKENPKELAQFRKKVLTNISSFFSDPKDIRLCVYESLSEFEANPSLKGWVAAEDLVSNSLLQKDLERITVENVGLKQQIASMELRLLQQQTRTESDKESKEDLDQLIKDLSAISIKVPAELSESKEEFENSLALLFEANYEALVAGITNSSGISDVNAFLFYNVAPKLQIYGLARNEKLPGVAFRRFCTTAKGDRLLVELHRRRAASNSGSKKKPSANGKRKPVEAAE